MRVIHVCIKVYRPLEKVMVWVQAACLICINMAAWAWVRLMRINQQQTAINMKEQDTWHF